jgi:NADH:ubiquinone oxidoreductase subunit F (NADH-binding)
MNTNIKIVFTIFLFIILVVIVIWLYLKSKCETCQVCEPCKKGSKNQPELDIQFSENNLPSNVYKDMFTRSSIWVGGYPLDTSKLINV